MEACLKLVSPCDGGFSVVLDRESLGDLAGFFVNGRDLSPGLAIPDDGDPRVFKALQGFMFTCGPDHIRHAVLPFALHGAFCGHKPCFGPVTSHSAELEVDIAHADGAQSRLKRSWHFDEQGRLCLIDRLENRGDHAFPWFLMYHINIAGALLQDETQISGAILPEGGFGWRYGKEPGSVLCFEAENGMNSVTLGPLSLGALPDTENRFLCVEFDGQSLPYLQIWRNQKAPAHVLALEPCSHDLKKRAQLEDEGLLKFLQPGEIICTHVRFSIYGERPPEFGLKVK